MESNGNRKTMRFKNFSIYCVFHDFLKATFSISVSGIRINFMFKICQSVPDILKYDQSTGCLILKRKILNGSEGLKVQ